MSIANGRTTAPHRNGASLDRLPPHNLEAEYGAIGSVLLAADVLHEVAPILRAEDFYRDVHQTIWRGILELSAQGKAIDPLTLSDHLEARGELNRIGGDEYLSTILAATPHAANARYYAGIVREKAIKRAVIEAATEMLRDAYGQELTAAGVMERAEKALHGLSSRHTASNLRRIDAILPVVMQAIERRRGGEVTGLSSGFPDLDFITGGFHPGQLIILAARPSMGKSALAWSIAESVATDRTNPQPALFASLEMTGESLVERALSGRARVDGHKLRTGYGLRGGDIGKITAAHRDLSAAPIFIDDTPGQTMLAALSTARRVKALAKGLGVYLFDYGQLAASGNEGESRQEEVASIFRRLKWLARELEVPVVALSQLNRKVEERPDHQPLLSDLRESGSIEQDADIVILLNRPERYDPNDQPGIAIADVAKNRNGATGRAKLVFQKSYVRFENYSPAPPPIEDF